MAGLCESGRQSHGKSLTTEAVFAASANRPHIRWQGYENVARLYEDKLAGHLLHRS